MLAERPFWIDSLRAQISEGQRVFTKTQLSSVLTAAAQQLDLDEKPTSGEMLEMLIEYGLVEKKRFTSDKYQPHVRFALPDASIYELALSLRPGSFFSHSSAVFLHGITQQLPRTLYVNKEQSVKPSPTGQLTQEAINRALANKPRESQYIYQLDNWRIVLLNGKNTGALEVGELSGADGMPLAVTKLERTLIDIAVRPMYAGGVHQVLEAYEAAKSRISVNVLVATLQKMNYVYPYHQVIGFYMQRAGYEESRLARLSAIGMRFDFYLSNAIKDPDYDERWRLFIPKGF